VKDKGTLEFNETTGVFTFTPICGRACGGRGSWRRILRPDRDAGDRRHRRARGHQYRYLADHLPTERSSSPGTLEDMDPVAALREIAYYKDRAREDSRRVMAYRNAADTVERLDDAQREKHGKASSWQSLPGIGRRPAKVIAQAWSAANPTPSSNYVWRQPIWRRRDPCGTEGLTCTCTPTGSDGSAPNQRR